MKFRTALKFAWLFLVCCVTFHLVGCSTTRQASPLNPVAHENQAEEVTALQSVAGAISGKTLTPEDMKNLAKDIHKDKDARSAVQAITQSMGSSGDVVKYCPVDGVRFSAKFITCPTHGVVLKEVE